MSTISTPAIGIERPPLLQFGGNEVMVDLETLGTGPNSVIVSIGACRFSMRGIIDTYIAVVDIQSCIDAGMEIDASTLQWWMRRTFEARAVFDEHPRERIEDALENFANWLAPERRGEVTLWGNGADFDNAVLASAYRACGLPQPWVFWRNRCYRTVKALAPQVRMERHGTHHNALDDAVSQAEYLIRIADHLNRRVSHVA